MVSHDRFPAPLLTTLRVGKSLSIRAGMRHRFIGIWMVVVKDRVFVRSWSVKARSWYRTFLKDPRGFIRIGKRVIPVQAVRTRDAGLKAAVDRAYRKKYATPWEAKYAQDLSSPKSRATTIELRPVSNGSPTRG